jgi:tetratricopeptide (TPR) repeat protein
MAESTRPDTGESLEQTTRGLVLGAAPVGIVAAIMVLATWSDGAFDIRHWAPPALLACLLLAAVQLGGGLSRPTGPVLIAVVAIWGFTAWVLLTALWSDSPARAWEGGARTALYAGLFTLALLSLPDRRQVRVIGTGIVLGTVAIAVFTLARMLIGGLDTFLAGRLDDPVGYRNGTAALFAFAAWPLIGAAAPRGGNPLLRAAATSATVLMLGLAFLTQSRGVLAALVAGGIVSIAIGPERLRRAWLGLVAVLAVAAASHELLTPYRAFDGGAGKVGDADVHTAALALLLICFAALIVGLCLAVLDNGLRGSEDAQAAMHRFAGWALGGVAVMGAVAALVAIGNPIAYAGDKIDEFQELQPETDTSATRLGSVGGQRYDLWRVAVEEFKDRPLSGQGEGSYAFDYYRERRTDRNLSDPHSLPLQILAEDGLVGAALFLAFLIGIGLAVAESARAAPIPDRRLIAGLAAAGAAVLAQSATDWLWLIPGLTGLAFLALGLAANRAPGRGGGAGWPARIGFAAPLIALAVAIGLLYLSDLYIRIAREEGSSGRVESQLDAARTAADLDPLSVTPLYLEASALETMGRRGEAKDALEEALGEEPGNFVTLALLGDFEVRRRHEPAARGFYRRALALNPLDVGLQKLARVGG